MHHPFADHMKLQMLRQEHGYSKCQIEVEVDRSVARASGNYAIIRR